MINFDTFKKTINILDDSDISYWVFGGYALDGIREKISREHGDIDIYLLSEDLNKLINIFKSKNIDVIKRENMYFIDSYELQLGIVLITEENNLFVAHGNKTLAKYPKKMFSKDNILKIEDFKFRSVPNEILVLESRFSRFEKDKELCSKIKHDSELINSIEVVKIRDSKK